MAPIEPVTYLDCYVGRFVGVGECVFDHCFGANNRIASWEKVTPPADWKTSRNRWDLLHRWRVVLLTIAFAFLIVGGVSR